MFGLTKKETPLEVISRSTIDELLKNLWINYKWNLEETKAVLKKCTSVLHYAKLHSGAVQAKQRPGANGGRMVADEVVDAIYLDLCKSFNTFLHDSTRTDTHQLELVKELYPHLGRCWLDQENSVERVMLQKRLEVRWQELARKVFEMIKAKNPNDPKGFEKLFYLCKADDPITLEIAAEINRLF